MTSRKEYMKIYNTEYAKSHRGLVKRIYKHQIRNCLSRGHELPTYTEEELYNWYTNNSIHLKLHEQWLASNCDKNLTPSCDRLDNSKSYSLDNIELVTWQENKNRAYQAVKDNTLSNSGLLNNGHTPIVQYDFEGNRINEFISINECSRITGIDHRGISDACRKIRKTYKGYLWCYLQDESEFKNKLTPEFLKTTKKSYESSIGYLVKITYSDNSTKVLTIKVVSELLQISTHNIRQLAKGNTSNRTPKLPDNISYITLVIKDYIESN